MIICKVIGSVVSTAKTPAMEGFKMLLVSKTDVKLKPTSEQIVAVDMVGAGPGELVLVTTGSSSRQTTNTENKPVDSLITGIIDYVEAEGEYLYNKLES